MDLAFGRARSYGAPADQVGDVLRADEVEILRPGRHAQVVDVEEKLSRQAQALVDLEAAVEVRVVDQLV